MSSLEPGRPRDPSCTSSLLNPSTTSWESRRVLFILLDIGYMTRLTLTMERPLPPLIFLNWSIGRQGDTYNAHITFLKHKDIAAYIVEESKPVPRQVPVLHVLRLPRLLRHQGDIP
jgi:hypothetical protein